MYIEHIFQSHVSVSDWRSRHEQYHQQQLNEEVLISYYTHPLLSQFGLGIIVPYFLFTGHSVK
jgi:hypothetical protein